MSRDPTAFTRAALAPTKVSIVFALQEEEAMRKKPSDVRTRPVIQNEFLAELEPHELEPRLELQILVDPLAQMLVLDTNNNNNNNNNKIGPIPIYIE